MAPRVAIVAATQTKLEESKPRQNRAELLWEVVENLLQQTNLRFEDQPGDGYAIDKIVSCSDDFWDGWAISDMMLHPELGAFRMDQSKVADDGIQAVYYAFLSVLAGKEIALVVSHCKESQAPKSPIENTVFDPIYLKPLGLNFTAAAAMQANRYMEQYGITPEHCAEVVVKSYRNAKNNPYAQNSTDITAEKVLNSTTVVSPIRALDCKAFPSDGACGLILASEEMASKLTDKPVWIEGVGNCYDAHYPGERELADCDALTTAAKRAYNMARVSEPNREIDVAEISTEYSYQELLWAEGLGFCERGEGSKFIKKDGALPINPSGGVLPGNPTMVAGMLRVVEAFGQLRGEAGARQVSDAKTALAHGVTGPCGQSHGVLILRR
ncbi:thiolase family protein [Chloroflexota bacterium]